MEYTDQHKIPYDIANTRNGNEIQRTLGIAHAAQHGADGIIAKNEKYAAGADVYIRPRIGHGGLRRLQQRNERDGGGK